MQQQQQPRRISGDGRLVVCRGPFLPAPPRHLHHSASCQSAPRPPRCTHLTCEDKGQTGRTWWGCLPHPSKFLWSVSAMPRSTLACPPRHSPHSPRSATCRSTSSTSPRRPHHFASCRSAPRPARVPVGASYYLFLGSLAEILDGGYVGAKGAVQEGDRGGGSMGVTVCAGCPSGPVSREIRLTRWCRALEVVARAAHCDRGGSWRFCRRAHWPRS